MTAELKTSQRQRDPAGAGHHNYKTTGSHGSLERNTLCLPIIFLKVIHLKHGLANFLKYHFLKIESLKYCIKSCLGFFLQSQQPREVETSIVDLLPKLLRIAWGVVSIVVEAELFLMSAISFRDFQSRPNGLNLASCSLVKQQSDKVLLYSIFPEAM